MTNLSQDQIKKEFSRQVKLCSGIGKAEMLRLVELHFMEQPDILGSALQHGAGVTDTSDNHD